MPVTFKRAFGLLLGAVLVLVMLAAAAPRTFFAQGSKSITLECRRNETVISGMKWKLYRVGERRNGEFVLTGDFDGCYADLSDMSAENVSMAAQTIESFALVRKAVPLADGKTDANGELTFDGLSDGLYLALGSPVNVPPYFYEPSPLLLEVRDDADSFRFDAYPKIVRVTLNEAVTAYTVRKVWVDNDDLYEARPVYVTVDLFRDGELFDTVTLNEENNWQHRWTELETGHQWRVAERVIPVNYEVRIEHNETQFLIRNRHKTITDWGEYIRTTTQPSSGIATTTATTAVTSDFKGGSSTDTGTGKTTTGKTTTDGIGKATKTTAPNVTTVTTAGGGIPQTGQLWWPVLAMAAGGAVLVAVGLIMKNRKDL